MKQLYVGMRWDCLVGKSLSRCVVLCCVLYKDMLRVDVYIGPLVGSEGQEYNGE